MAQASIHALTALRTSIGPTAGQTSPITFTEHGHFLEVRAAMGSTGQRFGLGMFVNQRLVISWGPKDKVEIGAYSRKGSQLHGLWVPPTARGSDLSICGHEESEVRGENTFEIVRAVAIDGSSYTGKVAVEPFSDTPTRPRPVRMSWTLHDGNYGSFAIEFRDALFAIFSFEPETWHAISVFEPSADGTYAGVVLEKDATQLGTETLS